MSSAVSVVIPHFNRSALLEQTVSSVLAADQSVEIIVVDDGSAEPEWDAIEHLESRGVALLRRKDGQKGPARCRNVGAKASSGDFLVFIDSDDLMAPWCIEHRLAFSRLNPEADVWIFPVMLFESKPGDRESLWNALDSAEDDAMRFVHADPPWHTSSPMWKKSSFLQLGGFNEGLTYGDDSDLHLRALLANVTHLKATECLPDVFVRRSREPRITNTIDEAAITSRLDRLTAGTRFLRTSPAFGRYLRAWSGQYFREAEFLLFNVSQPETAIQRLLEAWRRDMPESERIHGIAAAYLRVAVAARDNAYVALRAARRLAMKLLPSDFFPIPGQFETATPTPHVLQELRRRITAAAA